MRIDFSEPECSTCFHNRTSGVVNPPVPEPPVTSTPVSSEPAQALGHDSASASDVASTSSSSPAQAQAFGHDSAAAAVASTSTSSSSPAHSSSPNGSFRFPFPPDSSAPTQAHGLTTSGSMQAPDSSAVPKPSIFGSMQAPDSSAAPKPSIFGSMQATGALFGGPKPSASGFSFGGASDTATSPPPVGFSFNRTHPVNSASTQPFGSITPPPSLWSAQAPPFGTSGFAAPTPSPFGSSKQAPCFGFGSSGFAAPTPSPFGNASSGFAAPTPSQFGSAPSFGSSGFPAPTPSPFGSSKQAPAFGFGSGVASATSTSSTSGFSPARSTFSFPLLPRNGVDVTSTTGHSGPHTSPFSFSMQAPVQASEPSPSKYFSFGPAQDLGKTAPPPPPSLFRNNVGCFARPDVATSPAGNTSFRTVVFGTTPVSVSSSVGPKTGFVVTPSTIPKKHPFSSLFPGFGDDYLPCFGPVTTGVNPSSSQPSGFNAFSSNHKTGTHRWDVRERGTGNPRYAPTPCTDPGGNMISISASFSYQDKSHEELRWEDYKKGVKGGSFPAAVSSPASGCTACGATSSSSASGNFGINVFATPPSATHGACPTMNGTTTTTTPGFQAYAMMMPMVYPMMMHPMMYYGTNLAAQGTRTAPPLQAYPTMFGANLAAQGTTPAPLQAYPTMFGTNVAAQGARTAPGLQAYLAAQGTTPAPLQACPTMFGTNVAAQATPGIQAYLAAQGTTPAPLQAYPTMFGTNLASQGTTTAPGLQAYPMMFGTNAAAQGTTTAPGLQAYPTMFGANPAVQVTTPSAQSYPIHGLILLPFAAMNLQ